MTLNANSIKGRPGVKKSVSKQKSREQTGKDLQGRRLGGGGTQQTRNCCRHRSKLLLGRRTRCQYRRQQSQRLRLAGSQAVRQSGQRATICPRRSGIINLIQLFLLCCFRIAVATVLSVSQPTLLFVFSFHLLPPATCHLQPRWSFKPPSFLSRFHLLMLGFALGKTTTVHDLSFTALCT